MVLLMTLRRASTLAPRVAWTPKAPLRGRLFARRFPVGAHDHHPVLADDDACLELFAGEDGGYAGIERPRQRSLAQPLLRAGSSAANDF